MTLIAHILEYLSRRRFELVHKGDIERACLLENWGYEADTCARRCRELAEEGRIHYMKNEKGQVMYKHKTLMELARKESEPTPSESREESKQIALI